MISEELGTHGEYEIVIQLHNENANEIIYTDATKSIEIAERILNSIPRKIFNYEKKNYIECHQCKENYHISQLSTPEEEEYSELKICQDCLEGVMAGDEKLNLPKEVLSELID